jgi:NMD protein affecting ribosome stability and mRNA decay
MFIAVEYTKCEEKRMTDENEMTWWESSQDLDKLRKEANSNLDEMADKCPYEMKLAVTGVGNKAYCGSCQRGGSYRYLIYDRLGFGPDALCATM